MFHDNSEEGRVPQRGSIVNCASVASLHGEAGATPYTASKHGVVGLTRSVRCQHNHSAVI